MWLINPSSLVTVDGTSRVHLDHCPPPFLVTCAQARSCQTRPDWRAPGREMAMANILCCPPPFSFCLNKVPCLSLCSTNQFGCLFFFTRCFERLPDSLKVQRPYFFFLPFSFFSRILLVACFPGIRRANPFKSVFSEDRFRSDCSETLPAFSRLFMKRIL